MAQVYDPVSGAFFVRETMTTDRRDMFTAILLNDGDVLLSRAAPRT
jgi:hypothetical protein